MEPHLGLVSDGPLRIGADETQPRRGRVRLDASDKTAMVAAAESHERRSNVRPSRAIRSPNNSKSSSVSGPTSRGLAFDLKGARVDLRVHEPARVASRRVGDLLERLDPRTVQPLLQLDEVLAGDATHFLAEPVVREPGGLAGSLDPGRDQRERCVTKESVEFGRRFHVARFYYVACYVSRVGYLLFRNGFALLRSVGVDLSATLRPIREARGLTQQQLADRCMPPMPRTDISQIETGKRKPGAVVLTRLAEALEVSRAELAPTVPADDRRGRLLIDRQQELGAEVVKLAQQVRRLRGQVGDLADRVLGLEQRFPRRAGPGRPS